MRVRALRSFIARRGHICLQKKCGDVFEIDDPELLKDIASEVVIVEYYPRKGDYKITKAFNGHSVGDVVTLYEDQAGRFVLRGAVVPVDSSLWRPDEVLPKTTKSFLRRRTD